MNERNQSGNAGGSAGLPNARSYHYRFGVDGGKNPNLPNEADRARVGGVLEVAGPGGAQPANQALPHEGHPDIPVASSVEVPVFAFRVAKRLDDISAKIAIYADAEKAHREIRAMCQSARRSLGQLTRKDYLAKRFVPAPPPAPQWVQLWVNHFFNLSKPRWPR